MSRDNGRPRKLPQEERVEQTIWGGMLSETNGPALLRQNPITGKNRLLRFSKDKRIGSDPVELSSTDRARVAEGSEHTGDILVKKEAIAAQDGEINQAVAKVDREIDVAKVLKARHGIELASPPGGERQRG